MLKKKRKHVSQIKLKQLQQKDNSSITDTGLVPGVGEGATEGYSGAASCCPGNQPGAVSDDRFLPRPRAEAGQRGAPHRSLPKASESN